MQKRQQNIEKFIELSDKHNVEMFMVGVGAVQFHGYNRIRKPWQRTRRGIPWL